MEDLVNQRRQIVLPIALVPLRAFALTGKTAPAAGEVQVIQIDILRFRTNGLRTFLGFPNAAMTTITRTTMTNATMIKTFINFFICFLFVQR